MEKTQHYHKLCDMLLQQGKIYESLPVNVKELLYVTKPRDEFYEAYEAPVNLAKLYEGNGEVERAFALLVEAGFLHGALDFLRVHKMGDVDPQLVVRLLHYAKRTTLDREKPTSLSHEKFGSKLGALVKEVQQIWKHVENGICVR
jgi:hypothetical protein